jgi:hypothetical protein
MTFGWAGQFTKIYRFLHSIPRISNNFMRGEQCGMGIYPRIFYMGQSYTTETGMLKLFGTRRENPIPSLCLWSLSWLVLNKCVIMADHGFLNNVGLSAPIEKDRTVSGQMYGRRMFAKFTHTDAHCATVCLCWLCCGFDQVTTLRRVLVGGQV